MNRPPVEALVSLGSPASSAPHVLHVFPSYALGGVPIRFATILNHLGPRYRHTICALDGNHAASVRLDRALHVRLIDPSIDKRRPLASLMRIHGTLRHERPSLLVTHNWGAIEWALVRGLLRDRVPHVHCESGFDSDESDRQLPRRVRLRRLALSGRSTLVVPSESLLRIARDVWRIDRRRIRHIPNGVDCERFGGLGNSSAATGFVPRPEELVIGTVAPLRKVKNVGRLIRCFAKVVPRFPTARLLVVGEGVDRPALEQLAQELGVAERTHFTGHVERPQDVYPLMNVFALTSDTEQMPNTVLQAMAAGRAVASVDVGDVKSMLSIDNRRFVVARPDEDALAETLAKLLDDAALRTRLGAANRVHVRAHYGQSRMFSAYEDLFSSSIAPSGRLRR